MTVRTRLVAGMVAAVVLVGAGVGVGVVLGRGHGGGAAGATTPGATTTGAPTLAALAEASGRTMGFALSPELLAEPTFRAIADKEFDLVVPENAMKWERTEPERGRFDFTAGDQVADYAAQSGKELYGHTLVWHNQLPSWVSSISSAEDLRAAMEAHIAGVVTHYAGRVTSWDVVNEAFDDSGARRATPFQQLIGDDYMEEAFVAAHAADPAAHLCYNDYGIESVNPKTLAVLDMVKSLRAQGVPIDCVGVQAHLVLGQVPGDLQDVLARFVAAGVQVRITELDVRMPLPADATALARQADDYEAVVAACVAVQGCTGVTTWGLTDAHSWIPGWFDGYGSALLWDESSAAKPAYDGVARGFASAG